MPLPQRPTIPTRARRLVLAAWEPELALLRRALKRNPGLRSRIALDTVGVGLIEAAVGTARAIARHRPREIILVGTAGVYPGMTPSVGEAVVVRRARLASLAVAREEGYLPPPLPQEAASTPALTRALARGAGLVVADVACPLAITSARAAARRLAAGTQAALENLEAFAVARAALTARVRFTAVLGVTNVVGPRAHAEWKANAAAAAARACEAVLQLSRR